MNTTVKEKEYISAKLGVPYENLSQSYIRAETALATNSSISFNIQKSKTASPTATERLLELNDKFVITHLFIGLKQIASDTPTAAQHDLASVYTYENPNVFSGTNAANVNAIYNGSLSMTVNRKVYIPEFPVRAFRRVPDTQSGSFLTAVGTATTPTATFAANGGLDGFPVGLYGFYQMDPTLFDGAQTIDTEINLGSAVAFDDSSNTVYAVLCARGYLVVNAVNR